MSTFSSKNLEALHSFYDWMHTTGRARIVKFQSDGWTLKSLFDHDTKLPIGDINKNVSDIINRFYYLSDQDRELFLNSDPTMWNENNPEIYNCYRLFKLWWLTEDIDKNGIQAPLQIYLTGRNYLSHPGGDKKYSVTYLKERDPIPCFYIWYPEMDHTPWHWTIPYEEVNTPEEFASMFPMISHDTFKLMNVNITITSKSWDCEGITHLEPWTKGLWLTCKKHGKIVNDKFKLEIPTLTYTDAIHRLGMFENIEEFKSFKFVNDDKFLLGNYKFLKRNGYWLPARLDNFPKSIADEDWIFRPGCNITVQNTRSSASRARRWQ